jgi:hypothetical protein
MVRSATVQRTHRRIRAQGPQRTAFSLALAWLLAASLLVADSAPAKEGSKPAEPTWYVQTIARNQAGFSVANFWSSGSKLRSESTLEGHKIVTIVSGDTYYAYDALAQEGIAIRRSPAAIAADSPDRRPFGNELETLISQGAEKVRDEFISGATYDVYQITDQAGRRLIWVRQDSEQLPARIEIYDRRQGSTKYREFFKWRSDFKIEDAFFQPEPTVKLKRMELDEYVASVAAERPVGPAPVLHGELLHGPDR